MKGWPRFFQFYLMTWDGPEYKLIQRRKLLIYHNAPHSRILTFIDTHEPDEEHWNAFWKVFEEIGAEHWKEGDYTDRSVYRGTDWIFYFLGPAGEYRCTGLNRYPDRFPELIRAFGELIGDPKFGGSFARMDQESVVPA